MAWGGAELKHVDIFPKAEDDAVVQTQWGGLLSALTLALFVLLLVSEWQAFRTVTVKERIVVDTKLGEKMRVNFDVTFHALRCSATHIDVMDVVGNQQDDVHRDVLRQRLAPDTGAGAGADGEQGQEQGQRPIGEPFDDYQASQQHAQQGGGAGGAHADEPGGTLCYRSAVICCCRFAAVTC